VTLLTPWPGDEAVAVIVFLGDVFKKLLTITKYYIE